MSDGFKTFSMKVDTIRLKIVELAQRITLPNEYDAKNAGVMEKQFYEDRKRPTRPYEFFEMKWRLIKNFPEYVTVQLIVGNEAITLTVDGVNVPDDIIESRREHIEAMMDEWEKLTALRNER